MSDRFSVELRGQDSIAEALSAGSSGILDAASGAAQDVTAAVQAVAQDTLTARRFERQQSRARCLLLEIACCKLQASRRPAMAHYLASQWICIPLPLDTNGPDGRLHREQTTYKMAAILASTGITAMAITAVHLRFTWHMRDGAEFPILEAAATLLLTFGGVV